MIVALALASFCDVGLRDFCFSFNRRCSSFDLCASLNLRLSFTTSAQFKRNVFHNRDVCVTEILYSVVHLKKLIVSVQFVVCKIRDPVFSYTSYDKCAYFILCLMRSTLCGRQVNKICHCNSADLISTTEHLILWDMPYTSLVPRLSRNANIYCRESLVSFLRKHDVIKIGLNRKATFCALFYQLCFNARCV